MSNPVSNEHHHHHYNVNVTPLSQQLHPPPTYNSAVGIGSSYIPPQPQQALYVQPCGYLVSTVKKTSAAWLCVEFLVSLVFFGLFIGFVVYMVHNR